LSLDFNKFIKCRNEFLVLAYSWQAFMRLLHSFLFVSWLVGCLSEKISTKF
jgi:hypothetical protein